VRGADDTPRYLLTLSPGRATLRSMAAKMTPVEQERMDVAHAAASRLLALLKSNHNLRGAALKRMKLVEQAVTCFEMARLA